MKNKKLKALLSSVGVLLPCLFGAIMWNSLPDTMTTHFGGGGLPDGGSGKIFAVFGLPLVLLALQWVCILISNRDKRFKAQEGKATNLIYIIMPILSIFVSAVIYSVALGYEISMRIFILPFVILAVTIGNYMPKIKQNHVMGVKLKWTLQSEENWAYTHRITGFAWFLCGLAMMVAAFLPTTLMFILLGIIFVVLISTPPIASFSCYKRQKAEGRWPENPPEGFESIFGTGSKKVGIVSVGITVIVLVVVAVLMFTGNITAAVQDNTLTVTADYYDDITLSLDKIDRITFEEDFDRGVRKFGYGSAKLSMGVFENGNIGEYTLYAYNATAKTVVIETDGKILAIALETDETTEKLYKEIENKLK